MANVFITSIRSANFKLYVQSLGVLLPLFFALDHYHYARWLSVHVRDLMHLPNLHPDLATEFLAGKFVVNKTQRVFSSMAIDQAHEQANAAVKGDGGAVGLLENTSALTRWAVAGPEISRVVAEFEDCMKTNSNASSHDFKHHDQSPAVQSEFQKDVRSAVNILETWGNPFLEQGEELYVLDSKNVADPKVVDTVRNIERIGTECYQKFVAERMQNPAVNVMQPMKKIKLPLFSTSVPKA